MEPRGSWSKPGNDYNRRDCTPGFPLIFKQPWEEGLSPFPSLGSRLGEVAQVGVERPQTRVPAGLMATVSSLLSPMVPRHPWSPRFLSDPLEDWRLGCNSLPRGRPKLCSGHPSVSHYIISPLLCHGLGSKRSCWVVIWPHDFPELHWKRTLIYDQKGEGRHSGNSRAAEWVSYKRENQQG